jgi:pectate lyase
VYHNSGGGSPIPQTPILGNATFSSSILTSSYAWVDLAFSGVTDTAPNTGYALVVSGSASAAAVVEYYSNGGSNSNGVMMDTTTNAGTNWSNQGDSKDVLFYMYGTFETVTPTTVTITIKYLDRAAVALQTGSAGATRVMTEVEALNAPVVP